MQYESTRNIGDIVFYLENGVIRKGEIVTLICEVYSIDVYWSYKVANTSNTSDTFMAEESDQKLFSKETDLFARVETYLIDGTPLSDLNI